MIEPLTDSAIWGTDPDRATERQRQYVAGFSRSAGKPCQLDTVCPRVLSSGAFVRDFVSPNYLLDGILQRGFLYSLTAPTGTGKTAVALRLMASVALGRDFAGRGVESGRVLMLVGENADDVRARWIALSEQMGFDASDIPAFFMPGVFSLQEFMTQIEDAAREREGLALVIVDTSAAYFQGEDENSNKELGDHARVLRSLTRIAGTPCVIANCHPTKNAAPDNLLPRGGGSFIAEMDGNLTCAKNDRVVDLHWQGKFRGPDFDPIPLELITVTSPRLVDTRGRSMPTVIARPLTEAERANRDDAANRDLHRLLTIMATKPGASVADLALAAGWTGAGGVPLKPKVSRLMKPLKEQRLVTKELNTWTLTPAGEKAAKKVAQ